MAETGVVGIGEDEDTMNEAAGLEENEDGEKGWKLGDMIKKGDA